MIALHATSPLRRRARGFVLPLALLGLWQFAAYRDAVHQYAFVPLEQVASAALELVKSGELFVDLGASLRRTTLGLATGVIAGVVVGALTALSRNQPSRVNLYDCASSK
jgi:sulfonate transport system permease protein